MVNDHPENTPADDTPDTEATAVETPDAEIAAVESPAAASPAPVIPPVGYPAPLAGTAINLPASSPYAIDDVDTELEVDFDDAVGPTLAARIGAEALGSFVLVLASTAIALYTVITTAGDFGIAIASGLALTGAMMAFGRISGGHFNPATTLGSAIAGRTPWTDVLPYWLAQLIGAVAAASVLLLTVPKDLPALVSSDKAGTRQTFFSNIANGFGDHSVLHTLSSGGASFTLTSVLLVEALLTAVLVAVFLGATHARANKAVAPVAVGLTFAVLVLIALPISNGGLNPARATAAALFASSWAIGQLWAFWVAPLVGAAIAGLLYRAFSSSPEEGLFNREDAYLDDSEDELDVVVTERG